MKDREFLLDAIGQIDDDLVSQAAQPLRKPTFIRVICCGVAACLALAVGCSLLLPRLTNPNTNNNIQIAQNLWEKAGFEAYSLSYQTSAPSLLSQYGIHTLADSNSSDSVTSKTLSVTLDKTIKFETLVAQRYAVYYSSTGYPVFYDTQEDREVDLQDRILGNTNDIFMVHMEAAEKKANELFPGMLWSETNRRLFWEYSYYVSRDLPLEDVIAQTPETTFMDYLDGWKYNTHEERIPIFWDLCWEAYVKAETDLYNKLYSIQILGIDAAGGLCILKAQDFYGNGCGYLIYDITTDTCKDLPDNNAMINMMHSDGYIFHFSSDSSIATLASPDAAFSGGNLNLDITQRFAVPSKERYVHNYQGEQLGVYFLNEGTATLLRNAKGASELFTSQNNRVLYYKQMDTALAGKNFYASDAVWFNRLTPHHADTDHWVFHTVSNGTQVSYNGITLQGNFVRFAAEETVVIMERSGSYFAYSLSDGRDITEEIRAGQISMYAHEQMIVYLENSKLYRKNIFQDAPAEVICKADRFILSEDSAFAFAYRGGNSYVTCYNIATLESCRIDIDPQMCSQLFSAKGAVLQMNYNAEENTLLLSYYMEDDLNTENSTNVDFYHLLAQFRNSTPDSVFPEEPTVITDLTVSQQIMEAIRDSAYRYHHPDGVITWQKYYPPFLSLYEDRYSIFEKLGLFALQELDVNGTQFILYEDTDEKLELIFYQCWGLFDYDDHNAGFELRYHNEEGTCYYSFNALALADKESQPPAQIVLPFDIPPAPKPELSIPMPPVTLPHESLPEEKLELSYGPTMLYPELSASQPQPLSEEAKAQIMSEVEDLLARKNYTPEAAQLIRDTVEQLCTTYSSFQTLFAFVDVPDTETYIREAILNCLDQRVDIVCFPCHHSNLLNPHLPDGHGDGVARTLHATPSTDASINAAMFLKWLSDIRSYEEGCATDLTCGYHNIHLLTMMNSNHYQQLSSIYSLGQGFADPNKPEHYLRYGQFMSNFDSFYTGKYFRLLLLTDYRTMEQYMRIGGDYVLYQELVHRYGNDGRKIFEGIHGLAPDDEWYDQVIETERLFLKLFTDRLNEIETGEDMASYLQLYRFYRQVFSVQYNHEYYVDLNGCLNSRTIELVHPLLDYSSADMAVAQTAVKHGIFNDEAIPAELQLMLAHGLVSRRKAFDYIDNRENVTALHRESFVLLHSRVKYQTLPNGVLSFIVYSAPNNMYDFLYQVDGSYSYTTYRD